MGAFEPIRWLSLIGVLQPNAPAGLRRAESCQRMTKFFGMKVRATARQQWQKSAAGRKKRGSVVQSREIARLPASS